MGEDYRYLYEQMKRKVEKYQDEIVPELRKLTGSRVEVVRCKDCARRKASADLTNTVLCTWLHGLTMPKDGFCSYGERKD